MDRIDSLMSKRQLTDTMRIYKWVRKKGNSSDILKRMILTAAYMSGTCSFRPYDFFLLTLKKWAEKENPDVKDLMAIEHRAKTNYFFYGIKATTILYEDYSSFHNELHQARQLELDKMKNNNTLNGWIESTT